MLHYSIERRQNLIRKSKSVSSRITRNSLELGTPSGENMNRRFHSKIKPMYFD